MLRTSNSLLLFPCLALGIYFGSQSSLPTIAISIFFIGMSVLWLYLAYRGRALASWLFRIVLILGMLLVGYLSSLPEKAWVIPQEGEYSGAVYHVQPLNFDTRVLVRLTSTRQRVAVHLPLGEVPEIGDTLYFAGTISQPRQAPNPGVFCYREYLRRMGVFGVCHPEFYMVQKEGSPGLLALFRTWLRQNITTQIRDPGLVLALVLGQRDQLGQERQETWHLLGITHLLAISGMHVGLVAVSLGLVVNRLPLGSLARFVLVQGFLLVYIIVASSGASAWRAVLVSVLGGYSTLMGRRQDPLQLWATVGWILLLVKPALVFDVGFILSFVASGGILLWSPILKLNRWCRGRIRKYVVASLIISLIAQLSLAPFLFGYFGEVALLGPIATLIFVPLVVIVLVGGIMVALGLGPWGVGALLNGVMGLMGALERVLIPFALQWRLGHVAKAEVWLWWLFFVYAGLRLRRPGIIKPKRTLAHLTTLTVVLIFIACLPPALRRPLEVTAVNVGQGDCYFVRTPSGVHLLIDGGGDSPYWQEMGRNVGKTQLVPYLQYRQVSKIDYVIVSHHHEDHLFGLLAVLETLEVGMVIDNGYQHVSPTYERYVDLIQEKGIPYHAASAGESIRLGDGITLSVLYPEYLRPHLPSPHNNNSLLLRLEYGGMRLLFTGDLENPVLYDLAHDANFDLEAQWLKVPHHGSRGSLLTTFYEAVDPTWAVISVGPNHFGHPHSEVTDYLDKNSIIWRTTQERPQTFHVWWGLWGRFAGP